MTLTYEENKLVKELERNSIRDERNVAKTIIKKHFKRSVCKTTKCIKAFLKAVSNLTKERRRKMKIELVYIEGKGYEITANGAKVTGIISKEEMRRTTLEDILYNYFDKYLEK